MQTDALISKLAADADPIASESFARMLLLALSIGIVVAFAMQLTTFGMRADMSSAWLAVALKLGFCLAVALLWAYAVRRMSVPGLSHHLAFMLAGSALLMTAGAAALSDFNFEAASGCVTRVLIFSIPTTFALLWLVRRAAPTQPTLTGFAIGISAGAIGATAYALGCLTDVPSVVAFRYGAAMLSSGLVGALLGYLTLRW